MRPVLFDWTNATIAIDLSPREALHDGLRLIWHALTSFGRRASVRYTIRNIDVQRSVLGEPTVDARLLVAIGWYSDLCKSATFVQAASGQWSALNPDMAPGFLGEGESRAEAAKNLMDKIELAGRSGRRGVSR
jgi:hypothetical protein